MKRVFEHRKLLVWISLFGLVVLTACSHDDDDKPLELVKTQFNFSLPLKGLKLLHTRMDGEVVQVQGAPFRGMDDVRLLCFNTVPSESTTKIGNIIEINTSGSEVTSSDDYSQCQEEIHIPVSTSYFGFYARSGEVIPTTHAAKMRYGIIETVGLGKNTYQNNRSIRFRPVPICSSEDLLGGSLKGEALLELLNDLMSTTAEVAPPNDKWSTVNNIYLRDAYERMTTLKTLSSEHVQTMLAAINRIVCYEPTFTPDDQGLKLAEAIKVKIAGCCAIPPAYDDETIELKPKYQGFPADLGLPVG